MALIQSKNFSFSFNKRYAIDKFIKITLFSFFPDNILKIFFALEIYFFGSNLLSSKSVVSK